MLRPIIKNLRKGKINETTQVLASEEPQKFVRLEKVYVDTFEWFSLERTIYMRNLSIGAVVGALLLTTSSALAVEEHETQIRDYVEIDVLEWLSDPTVVAAIKKQNATSGGLTEDQIIELDNKWRAEADSDDKPMIDEVLSRNLSKFLKEKQDASGGLISEAFVMDNRGLNVGQSNITSDYWQGDEAKWKKTFLEGPDAMFIDEVEVDDSTGALQSQASLSIKDPDTGEVIGAITLGFNLDAL